MARREADEKDRLAKLAAEKKAAQERREKDDQSKWRTWTDANGVKVKAKFAGITNGVVKLVTEDGTTGKKPLDKLSKEDQEWVRSRRKSK